jgi:hypothetical protein
LHRITIIHVIQLLAHEASVTGAIVRIAHVFVLVILSLFCNCFIVLLFSVLSLLLWNTSGGFQEMLTLFFPFPNCEKGDFSILMRDVSIVFGSKPSTLHRIQLSILSACRTSVSPTKSLRETEFHMVCYSILSLTTMYIVGSSHSWKQKNITGKRRIQTQTLNLPTQHSTCLEFETDHLLLTNDESCQTIGILI